MGYGTGIILNGVLIAALAKLLMETERPNLCGGIYAAFLLLGQTGAYVVGAVGLIAVVLTLTVAVPVAFVYFWLLNRFEPASGAWWAALFAGILAPLVL